MCRKAQINCNFLNRDLGDISCWSKFLTKNIQFLKWKSTKLSNAEISWSRNIGNPVSFISNIRSKILMGTKDIWIHYIPKKFRGAGHWNLRCRPFFALKTPGFQKYPNFLLWDAIKVCLVCADTLYSI